MPNIVNALMTYVRNTKGKYNYFSQSAYMRKYGWSGTDRTKLGGVWTGATGKKDIQGKEIYGLGGLVMDLAQLTLFHLRIRAMLRIIFICQKLRALFVGL
ncbi:hypothetical protein D8682_16370 [Buttiauxella sp. 3AFRM03]|nr:hypothetical protein D8682_16370 [Buttiauxella sp. 3AFRM03]